METVIIGNPNSGRGGKQAVLKRCAEILAEQGDEVEIWPTERPDHATELADLSGAKLIVAAGGDGTVNEVINGLPKDAALGILPLGTVNVLARELGIPRNPHHAARRILRGERSRIDLGVATNQRGEERRFACMAGIGFDADVVRTVTPRLKRYLRVLAFPLTAFKVFFEKELPTVQVVVDDEVHKVQFAVVANGHYYGGDFRMARRADSLTSGELEAILVERVSVLLRPDVLARFLAREPLGRSQKALSAHNIYVRAPGAEVPVQLDGEVWGRLPMSFRVEPNALQIVC